MALTNEELDNLISEGRNVEDRTGSLDLVELIERLTDAVDLLYDQKSEVERIITAVQEARVNHPSCDRYEEDDAIHCGWKTVVLDIDSALGNLEADNG